MTEVIITSILSGLHQKNQCFEGGCWYKFNDLNGASYGLDKKVETISQKILESNTHVCRSYNGKTGRGAFLPGGHIGENFVEKRFC